MGVNLVATDIVINCTTCARDDVRTFVAPFIGKAHGALIRSLAAAYKIYDIELFSMVASAAASGDRLRGTREIMFSGNNAAAGSQ